ncbi:MAG: hypothetical protein ACFFCS_19385 [Candidatus Hodarchaeota archaeon]
MLNHRLIDPPREPDKFVVAAVEFLQKHAKDKKVFCALSGGIDSSCTYLLLKEAKINTIPVFIDHGLMRIIRGKEEREHIKKLFPDVMIIDIRDKFLPQIINEEDAENKRKLFKKAYSDTISKVIDEEKCDLLADGTILPDIEESFGVKITDIKETMTLEEELALLEKNKEKFVKSQHNLDISYDVEATVQPVASLTKDEVRAVLDYLKMPQELVYRKAFPGPALSARIVGPVTMENLAFEKKVHDIMESSVDDHYIEKHGRSMIINDSGMQEPFQAFAVVSENVLERKVTGLVGGKRTYLLPKLEKGEWDHDALIKKASNLEGCGRLFFELGTKDGGKYDVILRSINSRDARTAEVTNLPFELIESVKDKILAIPETKNVYIDMTPKPPGTIEYV